MRTRYRRRRDTLVNALAELLPEAEVKGIAAGLHAAVELPPGYDEQMILIAAHRRRIELTAMGSNRIATTGPPTLLLGYAQNSEPMIRTAVTELAEAINASRRPSLHR